MIAGTSLRWSIYESPGSPGMRPKPYLRQILSFIGIHDVQTAPAQGMNIPTPARHAIRDVEKTTEAFAP